MKSSFHSLIPFLPGLLNHSTAISRDSLNSYFSWPGILVISLGVDPTENTVSIIIAQQYFNCCLCIHCCGNLFTESLPSNERLLWLCYSGFQASCHNIKDVIEKLKNNRSPGSDNIIAGLFKIKQNVLDIPLHKVIYQVWKDEVIPEQWEEGLICPIYKKGDQLQPINYRGITLLNTGYKIFSNILYERLQTYVEKTVRNYQSGF
jgi:hypothetical protein